MNDKVLFELEIDPALYEQVAELAKIKKITPDEYVALYLVQV